MRISLIPTFITAGIIMASSAQAAVNIVIVSDNASDPIVSYINTNFSNVGTVTVGSYTSGAPTGLTSADLVFISRNTNSGNYSTNGAEIDSWNNLTANVILGSAYLMRNNRFGWQDTGGLQSVSTAASESTVTTLGIADSLLTGVTVTPPSNTADLWNVDGSGGTMDRFADGAAGLGGGDSLVTANSGNALVLARFDSGDALATTGTGGSTATTHGGDRIFLAMHAGASSNNPSNMTDDGRLVLENALVEFGLVAVPEPTTSLLFGLGSLFLMKRRRA